MNSVKTTFDGIISVHIGAGYHSPSRETEYRNVCVDACKKAISVLRSGGSAVDAITVAIETLENADCTNAGVGSNLAIDGSVECDASIMDGRTLLFGAAGAISAVKNPILVAKRLIECQKKESLSLGRILPCIMVGQGATQWAKDHGIELVSIDSLKTENSKMTYSKHKRKLESLAEKMVNKKRKHQETDANESVDIHLSNDGNTVQDTVGAVCVDTLGNMAAGVSSGGISLKQPGRLGPAAVYGAGCWAYNPHGNNKPGVAAATSGSGEHLIKTFLAKECAEHVRKADIPSEALQCVFKNRFIESEYLENVPEKLGGALVLKVNKLTESLDVELLWSHTTDSMCLGYMTTKNHKPKTLISRLPDEKKAGPTVTIEGKHFVL